MTPGKWYNSLRIQIVLLLTLALLPLGIVAVFQTNQVEAQAQRNGELALLAVTGQAAKSEELVIQRALGVARFFSVVASDTVVDIRDCRRNLRRFVEENDNYSFIGILPPSGVMTCTSADQETFDVSAGPNFAQLMENRERTIVASRSAPVSAQSIVNIAEPFEIRGEFAGFISISIPHRGLEQPTQEMIGLGYVDLLSLDNERNILTTRRDLDIANEELPLDETLIDTQGERSDAFTAVNKSGEPRIYTVVPISGSPVTVVGIWTPQNAMANPLEAYVKPAVFPILMWFAGMAVAILSIYTLVLRHISRLRRKMDDFAHTRTVASDKYGGMPNEIQALADNFDAMTDDVLRDEAELEDILREKNVLIKEVHHRVKNNLQLISSIMNMHIRSAEHEETRSVLTRLQDRVLSLATIHRDLYQSQNAGMVDARALVAEIVQKSADMASFDQDALDLAADFDQVWLYPDQAVPLSLLVAEAMANALKNVGTTGSDLPWIKASMKQTGAHCALSIGNSIGDLKTGESTGMGAQLINAFTIQLGGKMHVNATKEKYEMSLLFEIADFAPEARDY